MVAGANPIFVSIEAMSNYGTSRIWQELCGHHHKIEPVRVDEQCTRFVFFLKFRQSVTF